MPSENKSENSGERIAKVMARAGLCSRRAAEDWIAAGRVTVNGATIASPALNVSLKDRIVVDGKPLPVRERTRLFLYNKPRNLVTTHDDPQGRPTIFGALPKDLPRLISVGRLDFTTEGLLLLTNDGGLARILELPATGWLRRYRVRAHGGVTQPQLDALRKGIEVDGVRYGAIDAALDRHQGANVWLTFSIREGKNREVRNVLGHLGLDVNRLIRVSYGPFQLNELASGEVEEVKTRVLREQLGERVAAAAKADFTGPITMHGDDLPLDAFEQADVRPSAGEKPQASGRNNETAFKSGDQKRALSLPRAAPDGRGKRSEAAPSTSPRARGDIKPWDRAKDRASGSKRAAEGPRESPRRAASASAPGRTNVPHHNPSDRATASRGPRKAPAKRPPPRDRSPRKR